MADQYNAWLDEGFARPAARRARADFEVVAGAQVVITDDPAAAFAGMKPVLALYLGGMGAPEMNFHASLFRRMGYGEVVDEVGARFRERRRDEAAAAIPDELVDDIAIIGNVTQVRERIAQWARAGVTMLSVGAGSVAEIEALSALVG
jgi:alkanesulfonate monooxygenase SsuD/methylene tetrahydromethanopterin reductase-like flavin-dependent oxidoreductase (luciferase family)